LGGTNREEGGGNKKYQPTPPQKQKNKHKIPPTPSRKRKKQAHQEGMLSLPRGYRKFLFPNLSVSKVFLGFVRAVELISFQFLHLFLSRFVCFGCFIFV
jgi:hypothetical protein